MWWSKTIKFSSYMFSSPPPLKNAVGNVPWINLYSVNSTFNILLQYLASVLSYICLISKEYTNDLNRHFINIFVNVRAVP